MHRYPLRNLFPETVLKAYDRASRQIVSPRARFSNRVLTNFAGAAIARRPLSIRAASADAPAEILLYDEIGYWGVTAKDFVAALAKAGDGPVTLRINSPGGDVFDGYAIYNALKTRAAPVNVVIDGIAASAASFIAMAGVTITMGEASMMMIHNAQGLVIGDRRAMADLGAILGKIDGQIAAIYAGKSGAEPAEHAAAMDAETWYTADEALEAGLCDAVGSPTSAAPIDPANFAVVSQSLAARMGKSPRNAVAPYDPDGDGDNDAQQALDSIAMASAHLAAACQSLNGEDADPGQGDDNPEARRRPAPRAAATTPEWQCGAARDLPIDEKTAWDGPAAQERMLDAAGFNGESPDPAKAKLGFLAWDHHNPKLKGSYKLPIADIVDGKLTALKSGLDAAASRLPDTDIPDPIKAEGRAVIDAYEQRMKPADASAEARLRAMKNRLRLAEAAS